MAPYQPIETWIQQAGLNWESDEVPVRYAMGSTECPHYMHCYPEEKVLYRSDTHAPLSVVSQRFKAV